MPTTQPQAEPGKDEGLTARASQNALIRSYVAQSLGVPADMLKMLVHPVGNSSYRVNVWVGKSHTTARIADSFFLTADEAGNVTSSTPKIVRLY